MKSADKGSAEQIVPRARRELARYTSALVSRGLREVNLPREWSAQQLFTRLRPLAAISPLGQVATRLEQAGPQGPPFEVYDIEVGGPPVVFPVTGKPPSRLPGPGAAFGWSPSGREMVAASAYCPAVHYRFDVRGKKLLGTFGPFESVPQSLAWSPGSTYFASATSGGPSASLRLWHPPFGDGGSAAPAGELGVPGGLEAEEAGEGADEEESFVGYGKTAFHPEENLLVTTVELRGEWADEYLLFLDVPSFARRGVAQANGNITDLSWTPDGRQLIFCAAGQTYRFDLARRKTTPLAFAAELCRCHPRLPLCACFSSWLKRTPKARLFVVDLANSRTVSECFAEDVTDLAWSADGGKLYAVTRTGQSYLYELPSS